MDGEGQRPVTHQLQSTHILFFSCLQSYRQPYKAKWLVIRAWRQEIEGAGVTGLGSGISSVSDRTTTTYSNSSFRSTIIHVIRLAGCS